MHGIIVRRVENLGAELVMHAALDLICTPFSIFVQLSETEIIVCANLC